MLTNTVFITLAAADWIANPKFEIMTDMDEMARLHSAGAIVRHQSPFDSLPSHKNTTPLTSEFINKWVTPFYLKIGALEKADWIFAIKEIKHEITSEVTLALLGDFNWRTRLVGAYFTAVKNHVEQVDIIGTHLLKSEVCCVGETYALTMAFFNRPKCVVYLESYLDYYLTKPELDFDQPAVLEALLFLDKKNNTDNLSRHLNNWTSFQKSRNEMRAISMVKLEKFIEQKDGKEAAHKFRENYNNHPTSELGLTTQRIEQKIDVLTELNQFNGRS